jgi:serine/threonine protein kinase
MHATPDGFIFMPGTEHVTATSVVFDVRATEARPGGEGPSLVCKRLRSRAATEPWVRARLAAEGELLRQLDARGTPKLVAAGEDDEGPWIVMERVAGEPLAARLGATHPAWMAQAARSAFATLHTLHASAVVHADLNPDNILVSGDGRSATILDFGLAVWPDAPPLPRGPFRGTPAYAAPEIARGESFDARADLFGLAATLLHVASGKSPRPQQGEAAVLLAAGESELTPWAEEASRGLPGPIARSLVECCAFERTSRPPSASHVLQSFGKP